jgi:Putative Actinobacterial Holin-X, holin superfamily III
MSMPRERFESEPSLGSLIRDLTRDLSTLFRSEIALAKMEVRRAIAALGTGGALLAAALFFALIGLLFLFVAVLLGLVALGVPAWLSSLVVALVLIGAAAVLGVLGKKKLATVELAPVEAIESMKTDIDTIKSGISRIRET